MNSMNSFYVGFVLFFCTPTEAYRRHATDINIRKCKLTHSGVEYRGNVFTTKFKSLCRPWNSIGTETDSDFADGSRGSAKNFCRNPNGTRDDLWCYTYNARNPVESCAVPLCNSKRCRLSGPGVEYGGPANSSKSGYACSKWTEVAAAAAQQDSKFPDGGREAAGNRCRNPSGDPGGPWCYVAVDGTIVPDYCDTNGCDDGDGDEWTAVISGDGVEHGHYASLLTMSPNDADVQADFELKVWDTAAGFRGGGGGKPFRISLTAYPFDSGASGDGFEVPVPVRSFVRSVQAVRMRLSWRNGLVALTAGRVATEVLSFELNVTVSPVAYVSFVGGHRMAPVSVRFSRDDRPETSAAGNEEHVTGNQQTYRIFPLRKTLESSSELSFSVRAVVSASVTYYTAPAKPTPRLTVSHYNLKSIMFAARPVQQIKIVYREQSTSDEQLIFRQSYDDIDILSYWKWHQYTIAIVDKTLQIKMTDEYRKNPILLNITDYKLRFFHWFGIGSKGIAHWTLYCSGSELYPLPEAELPECVISRSDENYAGTQWITKDGEPCMPWNVSAMRKRVKENALIDGSYEKAKNYCRNPTRDPDGPYCFVAVNYDNRIAVVEKRSCHVRKCRNTRCSVTGIETDYVGTLNRTVSNRTCLKWSSSSAVKANGSSFVFPDGPSSSSSSNYCRNPTKDVTGPWCYVQDDDVGTDLCDVPGCTGDDSQTLLVAVGGVHWLYVLPEWRNAPGLRVLLKRWTPGVYETVSLRFRRADGGPSYDLFRVGADRDETIELFRGGRRDDGGANNSTAADERLVYPHLLTATRWTELLFEPRVGDDGRTAVTVSSAAGGQIFRWTASANDTCCGRIAFVGLSAEAGGHVGARFPSEECLVHSSESENFTVYLPINVQTNRSLTNAKNEIVLRIRQTAGIIRIALIKRTLNDRYVLEIGGGRANLSREGKRARTAVSGQYESKTCDIITAGVWTVIYLSWNESVLTLGRGKRDQLHLWTVDRPLLVRYFSVANRGGRTAWTANCDEPWRRPPDVDGPPRDGGWGEWSEWERCTKICGGGTGVRSRRCDNPRPNVSGKPCAGPATAVGACNEHECGQVSARTAAAVRRLLIGRPHHNAVAAVGDRLTVSCDRPAVDAVKADSPRAQFGWLRNGKTASAPDESHDQCVLIVNSCTTQDSGVYAFVAQIPGNGRIVLKLIAVSINDKPISVYIEDTVRVRCNAVTLAYVFKGLLTQQWIVNDSYVIKDYGINSLASIDVDTITIENSHFQGIWKCVVKNAEINSTWITSVMEIKVIGIATKWTRIMQDPIIKMIFRNNSSPAIIVLTSTMVISILCVCTWGCAYVFNRWREQLTKKDPMRLHKKIPYRRL